MFHPLRIGLLALSLSFALSTEANACWHRWCWMCSNAGGGGGSPSSWTNTAPGYNYNYNYGAAPSCNSGYAPSNNAAPSCSSGQQNAPSPIQKGAYRNDADAPPAVEKIVLTGVTGACDRLSVQWKELNEISDRIVRENGIASQEASQQPRIAGK